MMHDILRFALNGIFRLHFNWQMFMQPFLHFTILISREWCAIFKSSTGLPWHKYSSEMPQVLRSAASFFQRTRSCIFCVICSNQNLPLHWFSAKLLTKLSVLIRLLTLWIMLLYFWQDLGIMIVSGNYSCAHTYKKVAAFFVKTDFNVC